MSKLKQLLFSLNETDRRVIEEKLKEKDQQIDQLKQQLAEKEKELLKQKEKSSRTEQIYNGIIVDKDKEIERLKSEIVKECKEHQEFIKEAKQITNQLKSNYQTQLAIQELEKTLNFIENVFDKALKNCSLNNGYYDQILDFIDQQIKELKRVKRRIK